MSTQLYNTLNIRKNEYPKVGMFSALFILFGLYFGLLEITGFALFLEVYSPSQLPLAILLGGVAGFLFYPFFTAVYVSTSAKFYSTYSLFIYFLVPGLIIVSSYFYPVRGTIYLLVIYLIPLGLTGIQLFWASVSNFFNSDQNKRFKIYFELCFTLGIAAAGYGAILYLMYFPKVENLFFFAMAAIISVLIIQAIINFLYQVNIDSERRKTRSKKAGFAFSSLWKRPFRLYFSLFTFLGIIIIFFINYTFYSAVYNNYASSIGYAKFFGLFNGSMVLFSFILKYFIVKKILSPYDSPYSSILSPLFVAIAIGFGLLLYYALGSNEIFAGFSVFFILVSLIKLVSQSVFESIEKPSAGVLIKVTLAPTQDVFRRVLHGPIVMAGIIVTGGLLFLAYQISGIQLAHILIIPAVIAIIRIFINTRLLKTYQKELDGLIKYVQTAQNYGLKKVIALKDRIYKLSVLDSVEKMMYTLKIAENNYPSDFRNNLSYLIGNAPMRIKQYALNKIEELNIIEFQRYLDRQISQEQTEEYKQELIKLKGRFDRLTNVDKSSSNIFKMATSRSSESRFLAANLITHLNDDELLSSLILLLRDFDPKVKKAALIAASKYRNRELVPILIENLSSLEYYSLSYDAIIKTGENGLDYIEQVFLNTKVEERILKRLVKAMGEMGSLNASQEILTKIDNPSVEISLQALQSLMHSNFRPQDQSLYRVLNSLVKTVTILAQNFTFLASLKKDGIYEDIVIALEEDIRLNYHQIYLMLSFSYNKKTIDKLKQYIEEDDIQGNNFAMEVLDNFIDDNLKSVLIPVLQHSNFFTKFKQLQGYFSLELASHYETLSNILTSEYNQVSSWTKAMILDCMQKDENVQINNEIIACLFHTDNLIKESAACLIYQKDPDLFYELAERLDASTRVYLDHCLAQLAYHNYHLLREKVLFLKKNKYFAQLRTNILVETAKYLVEEEILAGHAIGITDETSRLPVYFIYKGYVHVMKDKKIILEQPENEIIDFLLLEQEGCFYYDIKAIENTVLYSIPRELLNLLLFDFPELEIVVQNYMNDFFAQQRKSQFQEHENRLAS